MNEKKEERFDLNEVMPEPFHGYPKPEKEESEKKEESENKEKG